MYLVAFELEKVAVFSVIAGFVKHRYFSCADLAKNLAHRDYYGLFAFEGVGVVGGVGRVVAG